MSDNMVQVLVMPALFFCVGWIVWIVANSRHRSKVAEVQAQMQAKLFEKFGSSQELIAYLNTDAGNRFLDSATIEHTRPFGRVLGSIQAGVILVLLGIAMLIVRFTMPQNGFYDQIQRAQSAQGLLAVSLVLLALGLGFLASAAASYKLSKTWGLLDREPGSKR